MILKFRRPFSTATCNILSFSTAETGYMLFSEVSYGINILFKISNLPLLQNLCTGQTAAFSRLRRLFPHYFTTMDLQSAQPGGHEGQAHAAAGSSSGMMDNFIRIKYSVIGEAFDPAALAYVGNDFCARYHISAKCEACPFVSGSQNVLQSLDDDRSVVLVPYFRTGNFSPGRNPLKEKRAHWSAIDTVKRGGSTTYDLYEGNWHGSISSPRLLGLPLPVTPEELINSNGDIQSEFDWDAFLAAVQVRQGSRSDAPILTGLDAVNEHKKNVVVDQDAANSGPFRDLEAYREQIRLVMDNIGCLPSPIRRSTVSGSGGPLLQPMSLAGAVVIVKHS